VKKKKEAPVSGLRIIETVLIGLHVSNTCVGVVCVCVCHGVCVRESVIHREKGTYSKDSDILISRICISTYMTYMYMYVRLQYL
jgi:hypothetical protein